MGIPAWIAKWNPPFLSGSMSGISELVLVPSGNIISETFSFFINCPAASNDRTACTLLPRSTKIAPDMVINGPRGVYRNDFFAMMDVCFGIILHISKRRTCYSHSAHQRRYDVRKTSVLTFQLQEHPAWTGDSTSAPPVGSPGSPPPQAPLGLLMFSRQGHGRFAQQHNWCQIAVRTRTFLLRQKHYTPLPSSWSPHTCPTSHSTLPWASFLRMSEIR